MLKDGRHANECSEADTWEMMRHYISLCPDIAADIAIATISSDQSVDTRLGKLATQEQDNEASPKAPVGRGKRGVV
jgi:hypothetical protein